jgi:hypothetical protein
VSRLPGSSAQRVASALLVGLAVLFVGVGALRLATEGGVDVLTLPLVLLVTDLFIAAVLLSGWYPVRPVAQGLAIFGALVHLLVLLRSGPWWLRGSSALLTVAHGYALVLLFQLSVREQRQQEVLEPSEPAQDPAPVPAADDGREPRLDLDGPAGPSTPVEPDPPTAHHPEPEAETGPEEQPEVAAKHKPVADAEPVAVVEPVADATPASEAVPAADAVSLAKPEPEPELGPQPEPSVEPEPEPGDNEKRRQPVGSTASAPLTSTSEEHAR